MGNLRSFLLRHRVQLMTVITPLVLLPLPILVPNELGLCGYLLLLMAVYWCTETLPLAVTGLIPVFLVPMFGIAPTSQVCLNYLRDTTMMFVGGLIVAIAIENSCLHKRIALRVLITFGTRPQWLMLGFMLPTWFLSMWISNTATTAMMLPIMEAVLEQLKPSNDLSVQPEGEAKEGQEEETTFSTGKDDTAEGHENNGYIKSDVFVVDGNDNTMAQLESTTSSYELDVADQPAEDDVEADYMYFCKGMTLAVAYAANVGGIATLTGTGPNTIMKGHADSIWMDKGLGESPVTYSSWIVVGFPVSIICVLIVWIWLMLYFLGLRGTFTCFGKKVGTEAEVQREASARKLIEKEYQELGSIRFAEAMAGSLFVTLVLLWFFRAPGFIDGWASFFKTGFIGDAVPAMMIACLLFVVPMETPKWGTQHGSDRVPTILDWNVVHQKYPWSVIFLMGGGFALAEACELSGLSQWIGDQLSVFGTLPGWVMMILVNLLVALLTEVTSNSATCTILMPIMAAMAERLGFNPLYLMFPAALSTSFAFMLPVATPPNAIAFSYGRLKVIDMVKAGAILNVLGVLVVTLATMTWMMAYFDLGIIPWEVGTTAEASSVTATLAQAVTGS